MQPAQHLSPHLIGSRIVGRRPHDLRRQLLEPLVVPPLRFGHLSARLLQLRALRHALLGLKKPLRGLHCVPRVVEHCGEVEVRHGLVGPQGDGLAVGPACSAPVLLRVVPKTLGQQLRVLVARLRGGAGLPLRLLARAAAAAPPRHPASSPAASSAPCGTPRAASKRKGSPGSRGRTSTSSVAFA
eukprot:scaffold11785_cov53-Phaeocystis_antarctica.AAC.4